jgi:hypothetical protein
MLLNPIVPGFVEFIIFILWILKGVLDCISTMYRTIKKLAKITNLLHDRLLYAAKMINNQVETKREHAWLCCMNRPIPILG